MNAIKVGLSLVLLVCVIGLRACCICWGCIHFPWNRWWEISILEWGNPGHGELWLYVSGNPGLIVCLQGVDVNPTVGKDWYAWASSRTCNTQTCMLVSTSRWHFRCLAPWPRKGDRISEPPHWISQEYSVHNGKRRRRPPPICWGLYDTGGTLLSVGSFWHIFWPQNMF